MLALTAQATTALQQSGVRIVAELSVGSPVSEDLTHLLVEVPAVRTSVRPLQRTPAGSNVSIKCYNHDQLLSEWNASGFLNNRWQGARVTLKLGVELPDKTSELVTHAVMDLDDVMVDPSTGIATLVCVDGFARLRRNTVVGGQAGKTFVEESPTFIAKVLLGHYDAVSGQEGAGLGDVLDDDSWDAFSDEERVSGRVVTFTTPAEEDNVTWISIVEKMLSQTNAGMRWNSEGLVEVYRFQPGVGGSIFTLDTGLNVARLVTSKPGGDIENSYTIKRADGAGNYVATAASPLEDATSITNHGHIGKGLTFEYLTDLFADNVSQERLDQKAEAPRIFELDADLTAFPLELWDEVTVVDEPSGLSQEALIFDKGTVAERGIVKLRAFAFAGLGDPWLFTENAQNYDDAKLVW